MGIVSLVAVVTSLPIEDTADVAAAEAGDHAALAPVNVDTQAAQIAAEYLADVEDAAAGGLAAKQEPAPVHEIPAPAPLAAPVVGAGLPYAGLPYAGLPYAGLPYAGLPLGPAP